ncbi:MAG: hypothetical protein JO128_05700 [Alphaproteobacteria bacterium]|nr:hypothetical protein [Alphaproteobacteria bacterium]
MGQKVPETSAERYRRRARELRTLAKAATREETRRELGIIAAQYEKLADDLAKAERKR